MLSVALLIWAGPCVRQWCTNRPAACVWRLHGYKKCEFLPSMLAEAVQHNYTSCCICINPNASICETNSYQLPVTANHPPGHGVGQDFSYLLPQVSTGWRKKPSTQFTIGFIWIQEHILDLLKPPNCRNTVEGCDNFQWTAVFPSCVYFQGAKWLFTGHYWTLCISPSCQADSIQGNILPTEPPPGSSYG